jgi:hypothetical protein
MAKRDYNVDIDVNNNDLLNVDSIALNTSTSDGGGVGKIWWNTDHETANIGLDANVTLQVGQEHLIRVKNASGSTAIPEFTFVMFAGATGDTVTVSPAVTDGTVDHQYMVGITTEEIPADGFGFVTQIGFINRVDTSAYTLGQLLYPNPSVAGGFTTTQPSAPAFDLPVAAVTRVDNLTGRILVRMSNGLRLKDLHDVQITTPADNEVLTYDNTSGTWINQTPPIVAQPEAPTDTSVLWIDTDEPAVNPISTWSMGGFESGQRYQAAADVNNSAAVAVEDTTYFQPFFVPVATTFSTIGCQATSAHTGTTSVRLGIYNNGTNIPTTVALDAGTVSVAVANSVYTITVNQTLQPGWYWLAFNAQSISGTASFGGVSPVPSWGYMRTNLSQNRMITRTEAGITGAFATAGTLNTGASNFAPAVFLVVS